MTAELGRPGSVHAFRDPVVGDTLEVVTAYPPSRGAARDLSYVDFAALRSAHGLVVRSHSDGLAVTVEDKGARIALAGGLTLSDRDAPRSLDSGNAAEFRGSYVDLASVEEPDPAKLMTRIDALNQTAAEADGQARDLARLSLAQFYLGNELGYEAIGVLRVMEGDLKSDELRKKARLTLAIANTIAARPGEAIRILTAPAFDDEVDALMWRSIARSDAGDFVAARTDALVGESATASYPSWVQQRFILSAIRSAIETSDLGLARRYLDTVDFASLSPEEATLYHLFEGRLAEAEGRTQEALDTYGQVIAAEFRPTRAEAVYRTLLLLQQSGHIDLAKASDTLSAEALLWRGNALEIDMQKLLARLYFGNHDYRLGFDTVKKVAANYPESDSINDLLDESRTVFNELFLNGASDEMDDIDALSLFYDFRQLTPTGARGDEMIRNLARRLVKVDLLQQAADLLQYQIDNRLVGVAKAQVAADLALIRIADRNPEGALKVLSGTRGPDLPPTLERQRRILEARALIDAGREDLALDLLTRLSGREAELLQAEAYWNTRSYTAASDLIETIYSGDGPGVPLSVPGRLNILKAGVGLVLANDQLGLSRIRAKFADRMAQSAEWPMFDYITSPDADPVGTEFKRAAREVGGIDSLEMFLSSYRQAFATDPGITPVEASPPGAG
jgi:hypothetical protein